MKLNTQKIEFEKKRLGIETNADLARQMGVDRQLVFYWLKTKTVKAAERFAKFFRLEPKDLIK